MGDQVTYLNEAREAVENVGSIASQIDQVLQMGDQPAEARAAAIRAINRMCDALQLACDLVSKEITASILEFNQIRDEEEESFHSFFHRTANRFSDASLGLLLHDGRVCGELHALGDAFRQPFSPEGRTLGLTETVRAFFTRSSPMAMALNDLHKGERAYLHSISMFLADVRDGAERATGIWGSIDQLRQEGSQLVELMREKRRKMQRQVWELRDAADECIKKLH